MVTAEIAAALPVLVLVVAMGMAAVSVVTAQLRCVDAAREAARAAARDEPLAVAEAVARRAAPHDARIDIRLVGDEVVVTVSARHRPLSGLTPSFGVSGRAVGLRESRGWEEVE